MGTEFRGAGWAGVRGLIVDMDGVLWLGDRPLPGLAEFFALLRKREIPWILATNNSSKTPESYAAKLSGFGVAADPGRILTSAGVAAEYLARQSPPGTPVYPIGGEGLKKALAEKGFVFSDRDSRWVVVGWDRELTWDKLALASLLIHRGAGFLGTNPDLSYPTPEGPVPGCGAQLAALEAATGVSPVVVGKPEPEMFRQALALLGLPAAATAVVGDRIETDLAGAKRLGLKSILVLSGVTTTRILAESGFAPDAVFPDLPELSLSLESVEAQGFSPASGKPASSRQ